MCVWIKKSYRIVSCWSWSSPERRREYEMRWNSKGSLLYTSVKYTTAIPVLYGLLCAIMRRSSAGQEKAGLLPREGRSSHSKHTLRPAWFATACDINSLFMVGIGARLYYRSRPNSSLIIIIYTETRDRKFILSQFNFKKWVFNTSEDFIKVYLVLFLCNLVEECFWREK